MPHLYALSRVARSAGMRSLKRCICRMAAIGVLAFAPAFLNAAETGSRGSPAVNPESERDPIEEWRRSLDTVDWKALPFKWALTTRRGTGRRQIAIFSDPNCPYCRRFERELAGLDDITVHVFMYPVIKPESVSQSKAVWCSKDRVGAWNALIIDRVEPNVTTACANPVDELLALGRRLKVSMTPTWFLPDGTRHQGAFAVRDIIPLLDKAAPR